MPNNGTNVCPEMAFETHVHKLAVYTYTVEEWRDLEIYHCSFALIHLNKIYKYKRILVIYQVLTDSIFYRFLLVLDNKIQSLNHHCKLIA